MGDSNKYICRLCLEITPVYECETIDKIKKGMLEFLLINIDVDVSEYAVACNGCLERLQDCYNFKSYVTTFANADIKVDIKEEFQSEMSNENSNVCRLCMLLIRDEGFNYMTDWKDAVVLKDMISSWLPEIDLETLHEFLICEPCRRSMEKYHELMKNCQEVEQRIENYCQMAGRDMVGKVILEDLLKLKDYDMLGKPIIIKKECSDVENVGVNVMECFKSEEIARIQYEEINIKVELGNRVETSESDESENRDSSGNFFRNYQRGRPGSSKSRARKSEGKEKLHFCPKCPYFSKRTDKIKNHILTHSDNEVHRCTICGFDTDAKLFLKAHMAIHRGPTKKYGCRECPYETDQKYSLVQHLLKHKDDLEVEMHKCALCPYKSKYRDAVVAHRKMQHEENLETYKCKECSFGTKYKASLTNHQVVHKNPQETLMYKCEKCGFETKRKRTLASHMIVHQDPKVANKFKCEKCAYLAKRRIDVKKHMMVHFDKHLFRCDKCIYSSNKNGNLLRHKQIHWKDSVGHMSKCKLCTYEAKNNRSLKMHMAQTHMNPSVPNNAVASIKLP